MMGLVSYLSEHGYFLAGCRGPVVFNKAWQDSICADTNVEPIYVEEK